jgi:nucleotide-binding universal stress UspA family protein
MQVKRVVIATDFSEPAKEAARWTARVFAPDAELTLVHAIHVPEVPEFLRARVPPVAAVVESMRESALRCLDELDTELGGGAAMEVRLGRPAEEIASVARERNADLVVIGKHGDRPGVLHRLGCAAESTLTASPVPVLLATGERDAPPGKILVAVDDADITPHVLRWARWLADRFGATCTLLHVVSSAVASHVLSMAAIGGAEVDEHDPESVKRSFRDETDRWLRHLADAGLEPDRARSEVAFGHPAQEILAMADGIGADLVLIGSRGAGRVRRAVLGSTASEVLRGATRPTLVVKEPEDELAT